jgi:hypothetical protein
MAECKDCKRRREHFSAVLPFSVAEKIVDKPCKIRGIAMTAGMSRNRNVYTAEELEAFAPKLVGAPIYMEHVSAANAVGKVTKTEWIAPYLWYEAEVYDDQVAEQIRKGLIQHVSVGADYDALDVVDAAIPHGLHDAELSLVAVPGIPETNVQVLERLRESLAHKGSVKVKEQGGDVSCVFCGKPADFLISVCQSCFDQFPVASSASPGAQSGVENLEEKDMNTIAEKVAAKVGEKDSVAVEKLKLEVVAEKAKVAEAEGKLKTTETALNELTNKLTDANKTVEDLRKQLPGGGLLKDPPKMMSVSEHVTVLEGLLPAPAVERSTLGMQRMCQGIRAELLKAKERVK